MKVSEDKQKIWSRFEANLRNEAVTQRRVDKLHYMYETLHRGIHKDLASITREDIEKFLEQLHSNKFTKLNGETYSGATKQDLKRFLKQFWKWYKGNNEFFPPEVAWIKPRISKDEQPKQKEIITIPELREMAENIGKVEHRATLYIMFDSGFRIDELLSVKKKDLTFEEYDKQRKCFWISCNRSKTVTRKIPIPLFTKEINEFTNSKYYRELKSDELLFVKTQKTAKGEGNKIPYSRIRKMIEYNGERTLKKHLSPHCFRHSSATYYAKALNGNLFALCQRFGWAFSSNEAKDYVRRSGAYQQDTAKAVYTNEVENLNEKVSEQNLEIATLNKTLKDMQSQILALAKAQEKASTDKDSMKVVLNAIRETKRKQ